MPSPVTLGSGEPLGVLWPEQGQVVAAMRSLSFQKCAELDHGRRKRSNVPRARGQRADRNMAARWSQSMPCSQCWDAPVMSK